MRPMLHWRTTAAMCGLYALASIAVLTLVPDGSAQLALLFLSFALILLWGNMLVRSRSRNRGA